MEVKLKKIVSLQNDEQLKGMLQLAVWTIYHTELTKSSGSEDQVMSSGADWQNVLQVCVNRQSQYDIHFILLSV